MIFEILNAKGKELASVDLIKNAIFEELTSDIPADTAKEKWLSIRKNLCSRNNRIEFGTFFRHFWIMRYGKVQDNKLYSDFLKKVKKTEEAYTNLLQEMEYFSLEYSSILTPRIEDYKNKKEYYFLVRSLKDINEIYGIVQIRPVLMSLLYLHKNERINYKRLKKIIEGITNFHFIYNSICSKRTSSLESPIYTFSHGLYISNNLEEINSACVEFKNSLIALLPTKEEFADNLKKLKYSKQSLPTNVLSKHVINKYEMILSEKDNYEDDGSIEHILDEKTENEYTLMLGNLVLLEQKINSSIPKGDFKFKKSFYDKSAFSSVKQLIDFGQSIDIFDEAIIEKRFNIICNILYDYVLKKINSLI